MKIAFFEVEDQSKQDFFSQKLNGHTLFFHQFPLTKQTKLKDWNFDAISIFVHSQIDITVLSRFTNLKIIAIRATGFDNIDLKETKNKGIVICNVPAYGSHTVAEFTFALILSLTRKIHRVWEQVKSGDNSYRKFQGIELYNKTLGIIGTGKIGINVIKIAKGFGMKVLGFDAYPNLNLAKEFGFGYVSLNELLKQSDIISIHCPANDQTYHLINRQNINLIKKGAILINTARGKIVETEALANMLQAGHFEGVALDVLEQESKKGFVKEELELLKFPQVIITPHMAFYTKEAEEAINQTTLENILAFEQNKPINQVQ